MEMEDTITAWQTARTTFTDWQEDLNKNIYTQDHDYIHTIRYSLPEEFTRIHAELSRFGEIVPTQLEPLVRENNLAVNLPRLEQYNAIGERSNTVVHHPDYTAAGDLIYGTGLLKKMAAPGGLTECQSLLFLSAQTGEAGHNCPIACSAGIIRVLQKIADFPDKSAFLEKLTTPSFSSNFTGAQFLTEIQGGSDVGLNASYAEQDKNKVWRIYGEKWFCSNANADLIFMTARHDQSLSGTKGLGLFLVPAIWKGERNQYQIRRLKDKIGTRSMATGEIDFQGAHAIQIGTLEEGFHLVMDNVLHLSRLFNGTCVLGMARRALAIATAYARHRKAFSHAIFDYPLVRENLARIKAENTALIAAAFSINRMQDHFDTGKLAGDDNKLLLRLLVNMLKYISALWSVEHVHHALDMLAGNGTIETFSALPRLLRDSIVCENWEGTHNVLRMQILKDMHKYNIDRIFLGFMQEQVKTSPKRDLLQPALTRLEKELTAFRDAYSEIQALQIRLVVDRMIILYCSLALANEAVDQQNSGSRSKMDCLEYFHRLHMDEDEIKHDKEYLELINRIVC